MTNWQDPNYLRTGTARQRQAYAALQTVGALTHLQAFGPVLAGTIPLAIDVPTSDLDIICEVPVAALPVFRRQLQQQFGHHPHFALAEGVYQGRPTVVARFEAAGFAWEVFGQPCPVPQQQAVRHLRVEYAVLQAGGEAFRRAVQHLKQQGLKTEPAFAQLLQLPGDPYEALLELDGLSPDELRAYLRPATGPAPNQ